MSPSFVNSGTSISLRGRCSPRLALGRPRGDGAEGGDDAAAKPTGGKELVNHWIEVHWPLDGLWFRAQVLKHHKGASKSAHEQFSIHYPEDNVTEVIDLHKEEWRHITTTVTTSYRGTVIKSSIEEGMQVCFDPGPVCAPVIRLSTAHSPLVPTPT